jgi:putative DNA primase/helicase
MNSSEITTQFRQAMANDGILCNTEIIPDGELHRFHIDGDSPSTHNGWYILHLDTIPAGSYGCWKRDISKTWCSKSKDAMTSKELSEHIKHVEESKRKKIIARNEDHINARKQALVEWEEAQPASDDHRYLSIKNVKAHNIRINKNNELVVPLHDEHGDIHSLQYIDDTGKKRFLKNGKITGMFFLIGEITDILFLGEGYSTCVFINEILDCGVICAFNAGNILSVAQIIKQKYPHKKIVIVADNDQWPQANGLVKNIGILKATEASKIIQAEVVFPDFRKIDSAILEKERPTDFLDLANLSDHNEVKQQLEKYIKPVQPKILLPENFKHNDDGLFFIENDNEIFVSSKIEISALLRDNASENWGRLLEFADADGQKHVWGMPMEMLKGSGEDLRGQLLSKGLRLGYTRMARAKLLEFITCSTPNARARCVSRVGWHGSAFVMPDKTIGKSEERIIYQADRYVRHFSRCGTIDDWKRNIAAYSAGNSRLVLSISTAFAAMLLHFIGAESGGLHFVGESSTGKTTALRVAASVYGGAEFLQRWRATANGLEALAALRCDSLLILDELAQVEAKEAGEIAYMLANGTGKARATRNGNARSSHEWRILLLSAGEVGLAQHMNEGGKKIKAGQEVRLVDIPADAEKGLGMFENLHDMESGAALSRMLHDATTNYYGCPALYFLEAITLPSNFTLIPPMLKKLRDQFVKENLPLNASGQVHRVCERFALIAAAGEIASHFGITGWKNGESEFGAKTCFLAWLEYRGGASNQEKPAILAQIRSFFEIHGEARFTCIDSNLSTNTTNRAGFKKKHANDSGENVYWYYVLPETFKTQVCQGYAQQLVTKTLIESGWLEIESSGKSAKREYLPGIGRTRCYVFNSKMWEG